MPAIPAATLEPILPDMKLGAGEIPRDMRAPGENMELLLLIPLMYGLVVIPGGYLDISDCSLVNDEA
jgi:hypothetical protein